MGRVEIMGKMYESLMEGLIEDLQDNQKYSKPQGRKTVIEKNCEYEKHGKLETALSYFFRTKHHLGPVRRLWI